MLCNECPKRDKCKTLCKEAEEYVNQDYRFAKETPLSELELDADYFSASELEPVWGDGGLTYWDLQSIKLKYNLTDRQFDILFYYFIDGKTQEEIGKIIGITHQSVSKFIKKISNLKLG
jgi:hypothetical protein